MATKKEKKPRAPRAKQTYIEGTEPPNVPAIDAAADQYRELRDERMAALKLECEAQDVLLARMKEHNFTTYDTRDGYVVTVAPKEKVSVKRKPGANGESEE